jgi:NTP pyrophosphatase (non-canonical NTP hydrolase)
MDIISAINEANPGRNRATLHRRIMKLGEEYGEVSEAYLNVTSPHNGKGMSWDDVREEFADLLIVAVDVSLTPLDVPGAFTTDQMVENLRREIAQTIDYDDLDALMLEIMYRLGGLSSAFTSFKANPETGYSQFQRYTRYFVSITASATQMAMPDQKGHSVEALQENLASEISRKLAKWKRNRDTAATDGTD